jgi:hypothetical protein
MPSEQTAGETIVPLLTHQAHSMHVTIYEYIANFIKIGSGIQKLIGGDTVTYRQTAW